MRQVLQIRVMWLVAFLVIAVMAGALGNGWWGTQQIFGSNQAPNEIDRREKLRCDMERANAKRLATEARDLAYRTEISQYDGRKDPSLANDTARHLQMASYQEPSRCSGS